MSCSDNHRHSIAELGRYRMRKTWRTAVEKIVDDPADEYEWLHDIADIATPLVVAAFLSAIEKIRGTIKEAELRAALETGDINRVMNVLNIEGQMAEQMAAEVAPPLEDVFTAAGRGGIERATLTARVGMRFDLANPHAQAWIRQYDFGLIRQVSDDTREAVRQVVLDAFRYGGHPREQAREIRQFIGLTERQTRAVLNYRDNLILEGRDEDQIARMVERYRQRMLKLRAETIARTETIRASNQGNMQAIRQAADKGLLDRVKTRLQWLVVPDDRVCPLCVAIPLLNPNGISIGGLFLTPEGPISGPPLHPNCRCVVTTTEL